MANNLRKFNTYSDYEAAELVKPAVSLIADTDEVYFDQKDAPVPPTPSDFCRLTLNNGETVDIEGSGELTQNVISAYTATCVSAEIGTACTSIGDNAFDGCYSLTSCTIGSGVTSIGEYTFSNCTSLSSIEIPYNVESIGDNAFNYCSSLTSIDIPYSLRSIGNSTFAECTSLSSIDIPDSVESIGYGAFEGCSSLTSIDIPDSVTYISERAFYDCSNLTSIEIPSGVTSIGSGAFAGCSSLTSITSNAMTAPSIDEYSTFSDVAYSGTLTVPSDSQGYCEWMNDTYFSQQGWTIEGVTCGGSGSGSGSGA